MLPITRNFPPRFSFSITLELHLRERRLFESSQYPIKRTLAGWIHLSELGLCEKSPVEGRISEFHYYINHSFREKFTVHTNLSLYIPQNNDHVTFISLDSLLRKNPNELIRLILSICPLDSLHCTICFVYFNRVAAPNFIKRKAVNGANVLSVITR